MVPGQYCAGATASANFSHYDVAAFNSTPYLLFEFVLIDIEIIIGIEFSLGHTTT